MYLGVHYFGDLVVGALFGLVGSSIVYYVFQRLERKEICAEFKNRYVNQYM